MDAGESKAGPHVINLAGERVGVLGPPLFKSKWSNNTTSSMIHKRKSPCSDRAKQPGKDCPSSSPTLQVPLWVSDTFTIVALTHPQCMTGTAGVNSFSKVVFDLSECAVEHRDARGAGSLKRWRPEPELPLKNNMELTWIEPNDPRSVSK